MLHRQALIQAVRERLMPEYLQWLIKQTRGGKNLNFYTLAFHKHGFDNIKWVHPPDAVMRERTLRPFYLEPGTAVVVDGLKSDKGDGSCS
jgi:hypothetical protein